VNLQFGDLVTFMLDNTWLSARIHLTNAHNNCSYELKYNDPITNNTMYRLIDKRNASKEIKKSKNNKHVSFKLVIFEATWLGMQFKGNLIIYVRSGSQASISGVRPNWKILRINGKEMSNDTKAVEDAIDETYLHGKQTSILFSFGT